MGARQMWYAPLFRFFNDLSNHLFTQKNLGAWPNLRPKIAPPLENLPKIFNIAPAKSMLQPPCPLPITPRLRWRPKKNLNISAGGMLKILGRFSRGVLF